MIIIKTSRRVRKGFTLIELMIATVILVIVGFAIGVVIVDGQTTWNTIYDRVNSDVVTDGYVARKKFDSVIRNASRSKILFGGDGSWIEVYYYAGTSSTVVDRYARFYLSGSDLNLEYGQLEPRVTIDVGVVCGNVSECIFKQAGTSAQMKLILDNGTQSQTIVTSAVTHNK
jgi:prepilin-type N-terminal cleavage/methylation domain-containing protein